MANDSITTVLSIVAWGTKLTLGLYDFSVANSFAPATEDVNKLAKEVNLLSQVLRQIGSRLKEDKTLPSAEAFNVVRQILEQCQDVFREIESLIPIGQTSRNSSVDGSPQMSVATISPWRGSLDWNALSQARAQYLVAHLDSLKLTLSVLLHTLYTAQTTLWAKHDNTQTAYEAVVVEKSQMEILVIEQQLALIRAYRLYDSFQRQVANAPLLLEQSPQSQALIKRDEYGPSPKALVPYQESTLARAQPFSNEAEDLANVRVVCCPYIDLLLSRWTQIHILEGDLRPDQRPHDNRKRETSERRNWQAPAVESDWESEKDKRRRQPKLHLTTNDPILMHVNEPRSVSSPMSATPGSTLQPPGGPFSPQSSNSWGPTSGAYFPQTSRDSARPRASPGPSPLSSPRASFSGDNFPQQRPQTAFKQDRDQQRSSQRPLVIPWRLRINQWYWDHNNADAVDSNTRMSPIAALKSVSKDTIPITEIFQEHISREAIRELGYEYTKVNRNRNVNGRTITTDELCYCIEGALRFDEIARLVDLTQRIRNPRSSRAAAAAVGGGGPVMPPAPPLDRSHTAPVYGNKFRETHPSARDFYRSNTSNSSTSGTSGTSGTSDEDKLSSLPSRSKSRNRRNSGLNDDKRGSSASRSGRGERDSRSGKGNAKVQTLTKIAAGVGLATLLDGLPEMLSYL